MIFGVFDMICGNLFNDMFGMGGRMQGAPAPAKSAHCGVFGPSGKANSERPGMFSRCAAQRNPLPRAAAYGFVWIGHCLGAAPAGGLGSRIAPAINKRRASCRHTIALPGLDLPRWPR